MDTSFHANFRAVQWNINQDEINFVVQTAHRERKTGVIFCQLRDDNLPDDLPANHRYRQLIGTTVVLCKCGSYVITVYRNKRAFREDRKKSKFDNRKQDLRTCPCCHDYEDGPLVA